MLLRFLVSLSGDGFTRNPGEVAEVPEAEGKRYVSAGFAVPERKAPETTAKVGVGPERPAGRGRRGERR